MREGSTAELPDRYMGAINWMAEYYAGRCLDYQYGALASLSASTLNCKIRFVFPENTGISANHVASLTSVSLDLSPSRSTRPQSLFVCQSCLSVCLSVCLLYWQHFFFFPFANSYTDNLPLSPISCALALIPAKLKQFIPPHFQPLYDNPDLPLYVSYHITPGVTSMF